MGGERVFFVGTCNRLDAVPAELRRRFRYGTWMFDLPSAEERESIWSIHRHRYKVESDPPPDEGLTGADIRNCCDLAASLRIDLEQASDYIVPTSRYAAEAIEASRSMADGRFLSASYPGPYRKQAGDGRPARRVKVH